MKLSNGIGHACKRRITATFTGPRQTSMLPKAARPAAPCATYCYPEVPAMPSASELGLLRHVYFGGTGGCVLRGKEKLSTTLYSEGDKTFAIEFKAFGPYRS